MKQKDGFLPLLILCLVYAFFVMMLYREVEAIRKDVVLIKRHFGIRGK